MTAVAPYDGVAPGGLAAVYRSFAICPCHEEEFRMNTYKTLRTVAAITTLAALAAGSACAGSSSSTTTVTTTTVGPVNATITALNFDESGGRVNGFMVGTNVLLTFPKPVCGGIGALGAVGNSVTYSGTSYAYSTGMQVVKASSYTNGTITFTPAVRTPSAAYASTAGAITQLNYGDNGSVNGFVFTPTSGSKVFVSFRSVSTTLAALLTKGAAVSVAGTLESADPCLPTGTISEVEASSIIVGGTTYAVGGGRR